MVPCNIPPLRRLVSVASLLLRRCSLTLRESAHPLVDALCACARDPLPTIAAAAADGLEAAGAARGGGGGALGEMIRESFERELGAPRLIAEIESTSYLL